MFTLIKVRNDRQNYRALAFLKKLEECIDNQLIKLRKKLRNLLYQAVRYYSQKYTESDKSKMSLNSVVTLKAYYSSIALSAVKLSQRPNCPSSVKKMDKHLFETHLEFIIKSDRNVRWVCQVIKEKILRLGP